MLASITDHVQFRSVVAATDFSAASEKPLGHAVAIARYYGAKLWVVHVAPSLSGTVASPPSTGVTATLKDQLIVREGDVWTELQTFIRQAAVDLVVIGTHGRTGLKKLVLGSVAEKVFRRMSCPVLTIGPYAPHAIETSPRRRLGPILFATDFCESCAKATAYAVSFANRRGNRLALLHVLSPVSPEPANRSNTAEDKSPARGLIRAATLQRLQDSVSGCELVLQPTFMAAFGRPADKILWATNRLRVEAIVMGLQGKSFSQPHLSWSTAYEVVCRAPCPVLTIRTTA